MFNFLRAAPCVPEIQDPEVVKKKYSYWRLRVFLGMYLGYAFYYFTRKSFTFAMPALQSELGLEKWELGLIGSILSVSYGASKFVSGILGDRSNPRYFMATGLILTGVFNILFGLSSLFWLFAVFWGLNGWFQGWGSAGCAKLLTHWYSQSERGRWWSFWSTSQNLGGVLMPIFVPVCAQLFGWSYSMLVPGVIGITMGLCLILFLRDTPQSIGLPPIEKYRGDYGVKTASLEKKMRGRDILFEYVLRNKFIWVLAFSYFFVYVIRIAVNDWSMLYLMEVKGYAPLEAGLCVCWFEIGGVFGSLVAGWSSDLLFKGRRNPVNAIFVTAILFLIIAFRFYVAPSYLIDAAFLFLFGFFIFGPQMLIGMAAAELSHKKAAATANGFVGTFAYLGAATAGAPLGAITKLWGWDSYLVALALCAAAALGLLLPLWSVRASPKEVIATGD